jgi:hypothetical protein
MRNLIHLTGQRAQFALQPARCRRMVDQLRNQTMLKQRQFDVGIVKVEWICHVPIVRHPCAWV